MAGFLITPFSLLRRCNERVIHRTITAVAFILMMSIVLGACTAKAQLPVLGEAPDFSLTNQDSSGVRLSHFRGRVVVMDFIYTSCPDVGGRLNSRLKPVWVQLGGG